MAQDSILLNIIDLGIVKEESEIFSVCPKNKYIYILLYIKYNKISVPVSGIPNQGLR